jgi:hypothetical protein
MGTLSDMMARQKAAKESQPMAAPAAEKETIVESVKPKLAFGGAKLAGAGARVVEGSAGVNTPVGGSTAMQRLGARQDDGDRVSSGPVADSNGNESDCVLSTNSSIADLLDSEELGSEPYQPPSERRYSDEIPADAPARDLPDDLTESQQQFITLVDGIYTVLYDPELFGSMIRNIMDELQNNPEYDKLLADQDVNTMMRGLRESMGMAKIKKAEKTRGNGRTGAKASKVASAMVSTLDEMFNSEDF